MGEQKPGWKRVALGNVVDVVTEYWNRDSAVPERFVAGEHIDEGSLRIRRWGMTDDDLVPPTFNRRFRAGDVLFHSRNLKKLACPDFSGITGEKLFVLRSRDAACLLPELLPFLLQTSLFDEYVNRMWAGSTNKFLNKVPLVKYEFALPPLEEQRRLSSALEAFFQLDGALAEGARVAEQVRDAIAATSFPLRLAGVNTAALSAQCSGISVGIVVQPARWYVPRNEGVLALIMKNVQRGWIDMSETTQISHEGHAAHSKSVLKAGDVVAVRSSGSVGRTGDAAVVPPELEGVNCIDLLIARPGPELLPEYLCEYLNAPTTRSVLVGRSSGTMQKHLNVSALQKMQIPVVDHAEQRHVVEQLRELTTCIRHQRERRHQLQDIRRQLFAALSGA